jgi:two-component sensor histidine kinase
MKNRWFDSILNAGVTPDLDAFDGNCIRAMNRIGFFGALASSIGISYGFFLEDAYSSNLSVVIFPFLVSILLLNRYQKNLLAIFLGFVALSMTIAFFSIINGEDSATHFLFSTAIISLTLFYRKEKSIRYFFGSMGVILIAAIVVGLSFQYSWQLFPQNSELDSHFQRRLIYFILLFSSVLLTFILVYSYKKNYEFLANAVEEQETLLAELNHRVKNNMAIIVSLLNMQKNRTDNLETQGALQDVHDRVMSMALVHQKMYQNKSISMVEFAPYITELIAEIRNSIDLKKNITFKTEIEPIQLDLSTTIPLGLILNELITNAIKHAFPSKENPEIFIALKKVDQTHFEVLVADNGIGSSPSHLPKSNGLGLSLIESLTEQINGKCEFKTDNGLRFKLIVPIRKFKN